MTLAEYRDPETMGHSELIAYCHDLQARLESEAEWQADQKVSLLHSAFGLTNKEATLLAVLASGKPCTKQYLFDAVYGLDPDTDQPEMKIIDVFICRLRKKIAPAGVLIDTMWGRGYCIHDPSPLQAIQTGQRVPMDKDVALSVGGRPKGSKTRGYGFLSNGALALLRSRAGPNGRVAVQANEISSAVNATVQGSTILRNLERRGYIADVEAAPRDVGGPWHLTLTDKGMRGASLDG